MKTYQRAVRRDSEQDHIHSLADGSETQGALGKPSQSTQFPQHSHLYQHEGDTLETGISFDEPGHTHETILGESSGPKSMPKKESFGPRNDSLQRIGREWQVRSPEGVVLSKGSSAEDASSRYDSEEYDEAFAKQAIKVQDEDKWSAAKAQSQQHFKAHKWPYVQHAYKLLGGN